MISVNKVFYAHSERFQMQNMNVHIKAGEIVSLIGPNGSGKSTLLRLIARLLKQSEGDIILDGENIYSHFQLINVTYAVQQDRQIQ